MNRIRSCVAAAAAFVVVSVDAWAQGTGVTLPVTNAETLADKPFVLPAELPAERTLVLLAFERDQRASLATWKDGLGLTSGRTPWIEWIVVGPQNAFVRTMIERGLRREIPEESTRDRTVLSFTEQDALAQRLGLSAKSAHVLAVDRAGHVLAHAEGDYAASKAQALMRGVAP